MRQSEPLWKTDIIRAGESAKHSALDDKSVPLAIAALKAEADSSDAKQLRRAINRAIAILEPQHYASQMLAAESQAATDVAELQRCMERALESLSFRPWMEADMPASFPEFTPVHHIEVKTMPSYRMARVQMKAANGKRNSGAFWSLFNHIKRNDIAMTAPVQVDYESANASAGEASMAFLYGSKELGSLGADTKDGQVKVTDMKPHQVVSIGVRGKMSEDAVMKAHSRLRVWLESHADQYVASGPLRKMGYNSPFLPDSRKFFEVQIPVAAVAPMSE